MATPTSDAINRLIALGYPESVAKGYPESVAKRIASGELPMDEASRMARAEAQGLNTNELLYHWTNRDFNEFVPSETGKYASGVYTSPNKWYGEKYVESGTPKRMELLASNDIAEMSDIAEVEPAVRARIQELKPQGANFGHTYWSLINDELKKKGFRGLRMDKEVVIFDPSDIRSPNAAFDPEYTGPNILGNADPKLLAALAGGSLLGAVASKAKSEESQAKEVDPYDQALMDYTSDARFVPSAQERLIPMSEIPAEMKPMGPDLIRDITNYAGNLMGGDYWDYRAAEGLMNVADFAPYVGGAISLQQGADAYRNNRKWEGRMLTGLGLLEAFPLLGKMASESIKPIIRPTIRNWDKMGSPWDASDGLLRYLERQ